MQKLFKPNLSILIIGVFIFFTGKSNAADFENWTFVGGQTKIKNMDFFFHSANFLREGNHYFLNHTQLSLDFPSQKAISFGIGYKQEYVDFPTRWRAEYRPMLHLYYSKEKGNFAFRDRSRWEFRVIDGELINRYRNQVQLMFKKFDKFSPYISTEFSFYFDELGYSRQRTVLGSLIHIKKVNLNLFFGHQINEDYPEVWKHKLMMGTGLSYKF